MSEMVTIEISETTAQFVREIAARTGRDFGTILAEMLNRSIMDLPVDNLPDEEVLILCDMQMSAEDQAELSQLLDLQREGQLDSFNRTRLDSLMDTYRRGIVRKAEALRVAVQRGLRPALS
jgi:hypothetical protein